MREYDIYLGKRPSGMDLGVYLTLNLKRERLLREVDPYRLDQIDTMTLHELDWIGIYGDEGYRSYDIYL